MIEYYNPNNFTVLLTGPDGQAIKMGRNQRRLLPEFFERYCVKGYLRRVEQPATPTQPTQRRIGPAAKPQAAAAPPSVAIPQTPSRSPRRTLGVQRERPQPTQKPKKQVAQKHIVKDKPTNQPSQNRTSKHTDRIVGRRLNEDATQLLRSNLKIKHYPISNGIGVGILSYNRVASLRRLIDSIRANTDLRRTTVFISDDNSTDSATKLYLDDLVGHGDMVIIRNQQRLGVAGNTNRLLRCLARFSTCLLLNDDVEVLRTGWDSLYQRALLSGAIKHFCMRQPGVYGAKAGDPVNLNGLELTRVLDKPHGAVLAYTNDVVDKIGYFDERFGIYGMEHVDWSNRVHFAGLQPAGYYDVALSSDFFLIHNEVSAVENREQHLREARKILEGTDPLRGYVAPSGQSAVPALSCIIPCRDLERHGAIATVIAGIRAQHFPVIEIIIAEHDTQRCVPDNIGPFKYLLVQSHGRPFNKAKAFNGGVALATTPFVLLHDADLILPSNYALTAYNTLQAHDACHLGKTVVYLNPDSSTTANITGLIEPSLSCERVVGYFEGGSLACRRHTYWLIGGFHEDFWGYGVEDCEFYERLSRNCAWKEDRNFDFVHLWHGRSDGWHQEHDRNRELGRQISSLPMAQRIQDRYLALTDGGYADHLNAALKGMIQ